MALTFYAHIEDIVQLNRSPPSFKLSTGHFCSIAQNKRDVNFMQQLSDTMPFKDWKVLKNDYEEMIRIATILRVPFRFHYGIVRLEDGAYHPRIRFG